MSEGIRCSFCGKSQYEVETLIAGTTTFICDECIDLCALIMAEKRGLTIAWFEQMFGCKYTPLVNP